MVWRVSFLVSHFFEQALIPLFSRRFSWRQTGQVRIGTPLKGAGQHAKRWRWGMAIHYIATRRQANQRPYQGMLPKFELDNMNACLPPCE